MAPRTRSKKLLELPSIVLVAKAFLEEKNSKSLSVMKKLTESKDAEQQQALIRMWISLESSHQEAADDPPPKIESSSGVNPDRIWTSNGRVLNGTETIYSGADHRSSAVG